MGQGRVELPTSRLSGVRSNHLSYWPDYGLIVVLLLAAAAHATASNCSGFLDRSRSLETGLYDNYRFQTCVCGLTLRYAPKRFLRKEVIQPQVPLRLPCYDFTPVTSHSLGPYLPCGLV